MVRTLASVADAVRGELLGPDRSFGAVSTDTRQDVRGSLFVALQGPNFDGNDYIESAAEGGAAGALVSRPADTKLSQVAVADTQLAFVKMAKAWRNGFSLPIIAVTGSSGKTTVKSLTTAILSVDRKVCATEGNLNNAIGVPITLMRLSRDDAAAVIELGANHAGEIDFLADMVSPTVAIITNAGAAHLEGFGSVVGVAQAKGELLDHLDAECTAVLNADDDFFSLWRARALGSSIISFGIDSNADVCLTGALKFSASGSEFEIRLPDGSEIDVRLPLPGLHNVRNALAAAAATYAIGVEPQQIAAGLANVKAPSGRLTILAGRGGSRIIDDSYNANPGSVRAALDHLSLAGGTRIFVLGDMAELGADAPEMHRDIGRFAIGKCDRFIAIGELAKVAAAAFGPGAAVADSIEQARETIVPQLSLSTTVLVKASRSMRLERLVQMLQQSQMDDGAC